MGIPLESVMPWGRSLGEYRDMFALTPDELSRPIIGVGDGPASFAAEVRAAGGRSISVDPLYAFNGELIRSRVDAAATAIMTSIESHAEGYDWTRFSTPAALLEARLKAMELFLTDYAKYPACYIAGALPALPLATGSAPLCLCSHFLFTYGNLFELDFHLQSLKDMSRVANEVRVFPLITTEGERPSFFDRLITALNETGLVSEVIPVSYRFQKGADAMLRIRRK